MYHWAAQTIIDPLLFLTSQAEAAQTNPDLPGGLWTGPSCQSLCLMLKYCGLTDAE